MAVVSSVSPTASATLIATTTSANIAIPTTGTPTVALLTNLGQFLVFLAFGTSSAVTAANGGVPLMPGASLPVTIGSFTFVAAITLFGTIEVNITTCT